MLKTNDQQTKDSSCSDRPMINMASADSSENKVVQCWVWACMCILIVFTLNIAHDFHACSLQLMSHIKIESENECSRGARVIRKLSC